ncbi:MAG: VCBS repeat-containing protein, partial [bacterium]
DRGASVALFGLRGGRLVLLAESDPIGRPHRWLNPVGVADVDGDGSAEVAAVVTPHLAGLLTFYRRRGNHLAAVHRSAGFSNHAAGSRELNMAAMADFDGDGVVDIALPGLARETLRVVTLAGGSLTSLAEVPLGREISTAIIAADLDGNGRADLALGLADGQLVVLTR